jgi:hypothetical protein
MSLLYSKQFSQPLSLSGSFTGSLQGTASYATYASSSLSASYASSASVALSSSYAVSASRAVSSSYALSSSYAFSSSYALSSSYAFSSSYTLSSSYAVSSSTSISSSYAITASYALNGGGGGGGSSITSASIIARVKPPDNLNNIFQVISSSLTQIEVKSYGTPYCIFYAYGDISATRNMGVGENIDIGKTIYSPIAVFGQDNFNPNLSDSFAFSTLTNGGENQAWGKLSHAEGSLTQTNYNFIYDGNTDDDGYMIVPVGSIRTDIITINSEIDIFLADNYNNYFFGHVGDIYESGGNVYIQLKDDNGDPYSAAYVWSIRLNNNQYQHSEGYQTQAIGHASHTEGSFTQAIGDFSHAEGAGTTASGYWSHAEGLGTSTISNYQHAQGKYNIVTSATGAFFHGNGTSNANRSNLIYAHDSTVEITGSLQITGSLIMSPSSSFVLPLSRSLSPQVGSAYWSGSLLFVYNGTRYMSASFS